MYLYPQTVALGAKPHCSLRLQTTHTSLDAFTFRRFSAFINLGYPTPDPLCAPETEPQTIHILDTGPDNSPHMRCAKAASSVR